MLNLFTRPAVPVPVELRWLTAADIPAAAEIAAAGFEFPWLENDFRQALQVNSILGMVAERDKQVAGYVVYEVHRCGITILNLAVAPHARGSGIGRAFVAKLAVKLAGEPGCSISAIVNERHLAAQLWLKSLGFEATDVLRGHFDEGPMILRKTATFSVTWSAKRFAARQIAGKYVRRCRRFQSPLSISTNPTAPANTSYPW